MKNEHVIIDTAEEFADTRHSKPADVAASYRRALARDKPHGKLRGCKIRDACKKLDALLRK